MIAKYSDSNRTPKMLGDWYGQHTAGLCKGDPTRWGLGYYDDGGPIAPGHRKVFRLRIDLQQAFSNPYLPEGDTLTLREWLRVTGPIENPDLVDLADSIPPPAEQ